MPSAIGSHRRPQGQRQHSSPAHRMQRRPFAPRKRGVMNAVGLTSCSNDHGVGSSLVSLGGPRFEIRGPSEDGMIVEVFRCHLVMGSTTDVEARAAITCGMGCCAGTVESSCTTPEAVASIALSRFAIALLASGSQVFFHALYVVSGGSSERSRTIGPSAFSLGAFALPRSGKPRVLSSPTRRE